MMGNGFRGTRGWFHPEMFTDHFTRLNPTSAARMNVSRYFNTGQNWTENTPPAVTTPEPNGGTITISPNGMAEFAFTANDPSGISLALVRIAGNTVGSIEFSGETNVSATFSTPFAEVGQTQDIGIDVFDTQGNLRNVNRSLTFSNPMGYNLAPRPLVWADRGQIVAGESVEFSAWFSGDPDGSVNDLLVEWDTDGDGTYDTAPTTDKLLTLTPQNPGIINLGFRITDAGGAVTEGMPLRLRVDPQQADVDADLWMIEGE
jgi:hypothetical protein